MQLEANYELCLVASARSFQTQQGKLLRLLNADDALDGAPPVSAAGLNPLLNSYLCLSLEGERCPGHYLLQVLPKRCLLEQSALQFHRHF